MEQKIGTYITDKSGKVYDVNSEYLFDPKISTSVVIPARGKLTIVSHENILVMRVIASSPLSVIYGDVKKSPVKTTKIAKELYMLEFKLSGKHANIDLLGDDEKDVKIFFLNLNNINVLGNIHHNKIRPISKRSPNYTYLQGVNKSVMSRHVSATQIASTNNDNMKDYHVQTTYVNATNKELLISGIVQHDRGIVYRAYDILGNNKIIFYSEELFTYLDLADMDGDGVKEAYVFFPKSDEGKYVFSKYDITGPPYPANDTEMLNRLHELDIDFSNAATKMGVPGNAIFLGFFPNIHLSLVPLITGKFLQEDREVLFVSLNVVYPSCSSGGTCPHIETYLYRSVFGYIYFDGDKYLFEPLFWSGEYLATPGEILTLKVSIPIGGIYDSIIYDLDGDGVPEVYWTYESQEQSNILLHVLRYKNDKWGVHTIVLDKSAEDCPFDECIPRMVLYDNKIYCKTTNHLFVIHGELEYTKYESHGIGLRRYDSGDGSYLMTAYKIDDSNSVLVLFDPDEFNPVDVIHVPLGVVDPMPFYWDSDDNMTIFAVYDGQSGSGPGIYRIDVTHRFDMSAIIEDGTVKIKDADSDTLAKVDEDHAIRVGEYDTNGNRINPATEDTLSSLKNDFNTKIPQPFTYDSDGRVYVNAYLENSDIEIGAVEIKDADNDTRVKVDEDHTARVALYNTSFERIDPVTKSDAENINENLSDISSDAEEIKGTANQIKNDLENFHNDFNTKIPQPFTYDSDGRVYVNAYLENSDIEIGAVEIKDADNDTRVKVDEDHTARVGVYNTAGNRIDPATENTLKDIQSLLKNRFVLGEEDVTISTEHTVTITDQDKMFDKNITTYGTIEFGQSGEFIVLLNVPVNAGGIVIVSDATTEWGNFTYEVSYSDGTSDNGNLIPLTDVGALIPTAPYKRVLDFVIKNPTSNTYDMKIYEFWIQIVVQVSGEFELVNNSGTIINPATEETLNKVHDAITQPEYDFLPLNNSDVNSPGQTDILGIGNSNVLEVLIVTSNKTGSPSITFYVDVVEPISNAVIKTYPGETMSDAGVSYIRVANNLLGTYVRIRWDGSLDSSNYFSGVFVHVIGKR